MDYLEPSIYNIISYNNRNNLTSFLVRAISISCLILIAKNSNIILNKSREYGHPWLICGLRGIAFSCSSLRMILYGFVIDDHFQSWGILPPTLLIIFIMNGYLILSRVCSSSINIFIWFFSYYLFDI